MGKEITVGGLTRQKYISPKRDGEAIKEDYILLFFFQTNIFYYYTKNLNELFNNFQIMITRFYKHLRIIVFLFLQIFLYLNTYYSSYNFKVSHM